MFNGSNLNQDLSSWNTINLIFHKNVDFSSFSNNSIANWDVSNVKNMHRMFVKLNNHSLNNWDVSSVEDMQYV